MGLGGLFNHFFLYPKNLKKNIDLLRNTPLFDKEYYLLAYPDVRLAGEDAAKHYLQFGWREGRNPSEKFDNNDYLLRYGDVKIAQINPLIHYLTFGASEGRTYKFILMDTKNQSPNGVNQDGLQKPEVQKFIEDQEIQTPRKLNKTSRKISVVVTTYNHEDYIATCLDSIINQKGNFDLEIIIGDDASTDSTSNIIDSYVKDFPEIIFKLRNEQNVGLTKNLKNCLDRCSGDYVAVCEGDDYWIDFFKLQKQSDYLVEHPKCSMCFSYINLFYEEENRVVAHEAQQATTHDFLCTRDLIEMNVIGNFSCYMYNKGTIEKLSPKIFEVFTADWFFNIACSEFGDIGIIREIMSVYRIHKKGAWSGKPEREQLEEGLTQIDLYNEILSMKYNQEFSALKIKIKNYLEYMVL